MEIALPAAPAAVRSSTWVRGPVWDGVWMLNAVWLVPLAVWLAHGYFDAKASPLAVLYVGLTALFWLGHRFGSTWLTCCKFALDDFGTGLSSFGYLKHFPVDFLKIDGSIVKGVLHDPIDREMVRSINEIGHLTGKQTIAEWAENAEIIEVLRGLGVDYAQGYGVSQPQKVQRAAIA